SFRPTSAGSEARFSGDQCKCKGGSRNLRAPGWIAPRNRAGCGAHEVFLSAGITLPAGAGIGYPGEWSSRSASATANAPWRNCLERLVQAGESETTRDAHAACYLAKAEETAPNLLGAEAAWWLDCLEQEHENLRAALWWMLERAEKRKELAEQALRLCTALLNFWEVRGYFREGQFFLERALAASTNVMTTVRVEAISGAGFLALVQGDDARAEVLLEESRALYRS